MKTVTIEELLSWAFVHELPKGGGVEGLVNGNSAWGMIMLGTRVSCSAPGSGSAENYFIEQGEPNEDALTVGEAVRDLRHCEIVVPPDWMPLSDWTLDDVSGDLARAAIARVIARVEARTPAHRAEHLIGLVVGTAVLGREPDWQADQPKVRMVERGGKPAWFVIREQNDGFGRTIQVEVDGFSAKAQRPVKGAYRKHEFSVDPSGDIMGRLDRQLWHAALLHLELTLAPRLVAHRLTASDQVASPWSADVCPVVHLRLLERHRKKSA